MTELQNAKENILGLIKKEFCPDEIEAIKKMSLPKKSHIHRLEPIRDETGHLRIGDRMKNASISLDERHPTLLPYDHNVTKIRAREVHEKQAGHSEREHTLACLRRKYWIVRNRRFLYELRQQCVLCRRNKWYAKTNVKLNYQIVLFPEKLLSLAQVCIILDHSL